SQACGCSADRWRTRRDDGASPAICRGGYSGCKRAFSGCRAPGNLENRGSMDWEAPMRGLGILLPALGLVALLGIVPADAQHHGSGQKAAKPKTDAELIASAMSAAPLSVAKDATIVAVGSDGKLRTLRQGQGAFPCVPDDPIPPGIDPMCLDRNGFEWLKALLAHEKPPEGKVWLPSILKRGSVA